MVFNTEHTLFLIKPDALVRGLTGRIIQRIEDAGLKIANMSMRLMDDELIKQHYFDLELRAGAVVFDAVARSMKIGPTLALVIEGVEAISNVRRLVGGTYSNEAPPGTIRGDFAHHSRSFTHARGRAVANLVHGSANAEEAVREIDVWFGDRPIFQYKTAAEHLVF